jgi:hypothetical protein
VLAHPHVLQVGVQLQNRLDRITAVRGFADELGSHAAAYHHHAAMLPRLAAALDRAEHVAEPVKLLGWLWTGSKPRNIAEEWPQLGPSGRGEKKGTLSVIGRSHLIAWKQGEVSNAQAHHHRRLCRRGRHAWLSRRRGRPGSWRDWLQQQPS